MAWPPKTGGSFPIRNASSRSNRTGVSPLDGPRYDSGMASPKTRLLEVICPCCEAELKVDPATGAVITHKAKEKPKSVDDLAAAARKLKEEAARRDEVFEKHVQAEKSHMDVLNKKFEELFKQAKEKPDTGPFKKDIDLD